MRFLLCPLHNRSASVSHWVTCSFLHLNLWILQKSYGEIYVWLGLLPKGHAGEGRGKRGEGKGWEETGEEQERRGGGGGGGGGGGKENSLLVHAPHSSGVVSIACSVITFLWKHAQRHTLPTRYREAVAQTSRFGDDRDKTDAPVDKIWFREFICHEK